MIAIYKKELRSYFTSMTGYICMAFMLIVIGIYYSIINLSSGYPYFGYTLSCVMVMFLLMTPVLTMRILAEERGRKTDQLLFTSPLPLWQVILGKYLAMISVLGMTMIITCIYPLIMTRFGSVSLPMAYAAILGYFLYGAACIAIGMFLSSVTESQVIAALLTFFVLLLFYIINVLTGALPSEAIASYVIWAFVIILVAWIIYQMKVNLKIAIAVGIAAEVANFLIYFLKADWMAGSVSTAIGAFDMTTYFSNFSSGILDVTGIVFYLSMIAVCLFLTIQSIQRKRWSGDSVMTAVVLCIAIVINLGVSKLPVKYTQLDLSDNQLYTISEDTKNFVGGLDRDIEMYLIAQSGNEDTDLQKLLERYADLSDHITVTTKDPVVYPTFTKQYTSDTVTENSVIVVCGDRYKLVDYSNIYEQEINYSTYQYDTTGFDGEGQLTSAIDYVTSDNLPKLYTLTGHDENTLSTTMTSQIAKENIDIADLSLMTSETVPDDAQCVLIYSPQKDLSKDEAARLLIYLENGGHVFLVTDYTNTELPNLMSVLENYGLSVEAGMIYEANSQYYYPGYPSYLLPKVQSVDAAGDMTESNYVIMPYAQAITVSEDLRSTVTASTLLQTSSKSYIKTDTSDSASTEKASGDATGPFATAVAVTEDYNDTQTKLIYMTSSALLDEQMNSVVSGGNYELVMNAISWMIDKTSSISIPSKSLSVTYLTVTAASAGFWGTFVIVIPIALMIAGGIVWFKRRRM